MTKKLSTNKYPSKMPPERPDMPQDFASTGIPNAGYISILEPGNPRFQAWLRVATNEELGWITGRENQERADRDQTSIQTPEDDSKPA